MDDVSSSVPANQTLGDKQATDSPYLTSIPLFLVFSFKAFLKIQRREPVIAASHNQPRTKGRRARAPNAHYPAFIDTLGGQVTNQ